MPSQKETIMNTESLVFLSLPLYKKVIAIKDYPINKKYIKGSGCDNPLSLLYEAYCLKIPITETAEKEGKLDSLSEGSLWSASEYHEFLHALKKLSMWEDNRLLFKNYEKILKQDPPKKKSLLKRLFCK